MTTREAVDADLSDDERRFVVVALCDDAVEVAMLAPAGAVVVGRQPEAGAHRALCLADPELSRSHARFSLSPDERVVVVEDLGSRNGTWVGGKRVKRQEIAFGEDVRLGRVVARVQSFGGRAPLGHARGGPWPLVAGKTMVRLLEDVDRVAGSSVPVVLRGETGTGKELLAELLHERGPRRAKPFVKANCAGVPPQLVESTFFGHERGTFTGATERRTGLFEAADGGTLLLDEIGDLPLPAQGALLRVLDKGRFCRVGSTREIVSHARVVAATHRDLEELVRVGQFRADLFHRLSAVVLHIPPLRERPEDISALALELLRASNAANGRRIAGIEPETMRLLEEYAWPGNVRELKNAVERAVVLSVSDRLQPDDFPRQLLAQARARIAPAPASGGRPDTIRSPRAEAYDLPAEPGPGSPAARPLPSASHRAEAPPTIPPASAGPSSDARRGLAESLRGLEAEAIVRALRQTGWRREKAARLLGMPLRTLAYKIKVHGIQREREEETEE